MTDVIVKNETYNNSWIIKNIQNYSVSQYFNYFKFTETSTSFYFKEEVNSTIETELNLFLNDEDSNFDPRDNDEVFEGDLVVQSPEFFEYVNKTPDSGTVKLNNVITSLLLSKDTPFNLTTLGQAQFASFSEFPKTVSNTLPDKNPVNDFEDFIGFLHDSSSEKWFENPVSGQTNYWRLIIDYTKPDNRKNKKVVFTVSNPTTGFSQQQVFILADSNKFLQFSLTYDFITVADDISIANGYIFTLESEDQDITINDLSITRSSWERL